MKQLKSMQVAAPIAFDVVERVDDDHPTFHHGSVRCGLHGASGPLLARRVYSSCQTFVVEGKAWQLAYEGP